MIYRAVVYDNNDPDGRHRLKCKLPQLFGGVVTTWALPCSPGSSIPDVGARVWLTFENGEVDFPVWLGEFAGPGEAPVIDTSDNEDTLVVMYMEV